MTVVILFSTKVRTRCILHEHHILIIQSELIVSLYQLIPPPPTPAIARAMTNAHKLVAVPQRKDPMKNTVLANNNADLRPNTSEIRPSLIRHY